MSEFVQGEIMYFKTADGKEVHKFDMCSHCNLDTSGEHQKSCLMAQGYKLLSAENAKLAEDLFPTRITLTVVSYFG